MRNRGPRPRGFSLVEVALAVGLLAVIVTSLLALLPLGVGSTRETVQEAYAINLLTVAEAELRHPRTDDGVSPRFRLPLPIVRGSHDRDSLNPALKTGAVHTIGVRNDGSTATAGPECPYQLTLVYTQLPSPGSMAPLQARLIASWPCQPEAATTAESVTDQRRISGYAESYLAFPSP